MKTEQVNSQNELGRKALELLKAPDLFQRLLQTLRRQGLVGEERNALVLYLVALSAQLDRPINTIVKGSSSSGKNFLVNHVLKLLPKAAVQEITSSSKTAWDYGEDDFCHKVVYLQERNDAAGAIHPVRLLISEGKLQRIVTVREDGAWRKKTFVAHGPIASISTTTRNQIEIDDETRHVSLWVDESREQNRRIIMNYLSSRGDDSIDDLRVWRRVHTVVARRTSECEVLLPHWFNGLGMHVYVGSVTVRRYFPAFVEACRTLALLRSFQKERGRAHLQANPVIEVDFVDYALATILLESVFFDSLRRNGDRNLATRAAVAEISKVTDGDGVSARELAQHLAISEERAYEQLRSARQAGIVDRANEPQRTNLKLYRPASLARFVPDPEFVFSNIDEIPSPVEFIHPLTGEVVKFSRATGNPKKSAQRKGART